MGGEQAANVLAKVRRDHLGRAGQDWPEDEEEAFKAPVRANTKLRATPTTRGRACGTTA